MGKNLKGVELGKGITQRKDGKYQGRYTDKFGRRVTVYDNDLRVLKKKLAESKAEVERKLRTIQSNSTLDEWYEMWMEVYKDVNVCQNTKRQYIQTYNMYIRPKLGSLRLVDITKLQVSDLIVKVQKDGCGRATQKKIQNLLVDLFERALEDNHISKNPAKGVKILGKKNKKERFCLSAEQQEDFLKCAAGTFYDNMFVVAVNTGLRPGELMALLPEDIDFKKMQINVDKTLMYAQFENDEKTCFHLGPPKTKTSIRKVPINKTCEEALRKQLVLKESIQSKQNIKQSEFSDRLFVTKYNTPLTISIYQNAIRRIIEKMNIDRGVNEQIPMFGGHTFRHAFASRCFEKGIQPKVVQAYLGHASIRMTLDSYTHLSTEIQTEEIYKLDMQ